MGDVVHALPAVATLKHSFPGSHLAWLVDPKWTPLLEANPFVDEVIDFDRHKLSQVLSIRRRLRTPRFDMVVDFQGLVKSALLASVAGPETIVGYHQAQAREPLAALFYSRRILVRARHIVDRHLELATAAGASNILGSFPLPPGVPEGDLPPGPFVLAAPLAGWGAKQWPLEYYEELAALLRREMDLPLVLNCSPKGAAMLRAVSGCRLHESSVAGLIDATRRAAAVAGIDSGPLHLAAALDRPGVAIYGPTDPERNGPYGGGIEVLRSPSARTSYKRRAKIDPSMRAITPPMVFAALRQRIERAARKKEAGA